MNIPSESAMISFGRQIAQSIVLPAVIELIGDVGAGKTTFTRGLAAGLGVSEPVTSPSFTISKRYPFSLTQKRCKKYNDHDASPDFAELIHYDFYRLDDPGIMREDLAESLAAPNSVVVIEWGGDVASLLPDDHLRLEFRLLEDGSRDVVITGMDAAVIAKIAAAMTKDEGTEQ